MAPDTKLFVNDPVYVHEVAHAFPNDCFVIAVDIIDVGANGIVFRAPRQERRPPSEDRRARPGTTGTRPNTKPGGMPLLRTDSAEGHPANAMPDDGQRRQTGANLLRDECQGQNAVWQVWHELLFGEGRVLRKREDGLCAGAKGRETRSGLLRDELPDDAAAARRKLKSFRRG